MKTIILIALVVYTLISCNRITKEERVLVKGEGEAVLVLNTSKAGCHKCQKIIEGGIQNITGVS